MPAPTGSPTPAPTPAPTQSATAASSAGDSFDKGKASVLTYSQSSGVDYEIVQMVTNTSDGWLWVPTGGASTFTIFDADGVALDFAAVGPLVQVEDAVPQRIGPGESAYLICNYFSGDFPLSDYQTASRMS